MYTQVFTQWISRHIVDNGSSLALRLNQSHLRSSNSFSLLTINDYAKPIKYSQQEYDADLNTAQYFWPSSTFRESLVASYNAKHLESNEKYLFLIEITQAVAIVAPASPKYRGNAFSFATMTATE